MSDIGRLRQLPDAFSGVCADYAPSASRRVPLDLAPGLGCPYLGLFGAEDALIPAADVDELRSILERAGKTFVTRTYPGAGHAFFNDTRADAYRPEAVADAWPRAVAFLRQYLG
jgi:carboxymethylenebutenolidase